MAWVDLAPARHPAGRAAVGRALVQAMASHGYLLLRGSGLAPGPLLAAGRSLFARDNPASYAAADGRTNGHYMYESAGGAADNIQAYNLANPEGGLDRRRAGYFARREWPADAPGGWPVPSGGPRWPPEPELARKVREWYEQCAALSIELLELTALGLGLPEQELTGLHRQADHVLELKQYPARDGGWLRIPDHVDLSSLTLLVQDAPGGLMLWDTDQSDWVELPPMEGGLLVNTGLFMERWTGGRLPASRHRVVATRAGERQSAVFFCTPDWDCSLGVRGTAGGPDEDELVGDLMPF